MHGQSAQNCRTLAVPLKALDLGLRWSWSWGWEEFLLVWRLELELDLGLGSPVAGRGWGCS